MTTPDRDADFEAMTPAERTLHVQDLWDRIAERPDEVSVTHLQRQELDRRLAAHDADSDSAISWEDVRARLRPNR